MEVLSSHKLLFRLCLLLPLHITSLLLLSSTYSPPDNYFINCGAHSNTNVGTRVFVANRGFKFGMGEPFNVSISALSLLTNYSFGNITSSPKIEEFLLTIPKGELKIFFIPYEPSSSAFMNAIEVFLDPESFIPDKAPYITSQGAKSNYSGLSSKVLYKVHRIDVGGSKSDIASKLDELWRNWDPDDDYFKSPRNETHVEYKDVERITKYIAPAFVYQTARQFISNSSLRFVTTILFL